MARPPTHPYRAYRTVGGKIVIQGSPSPGSWVLLDCDNGNPELGFGYCWVFPTRREARAHRSAQNARHPANAWLAIPRRLAEAQQHMLKLFKTPLRGRSNIKYVNDNIDWRR